MSAPMDIPATITAGFSFLEAVTALVKGQLPTEAERARAFQLRYPLMFERVRLKTMRVKAKEIEFAKKTIIKHNLQISSLAVSTYSGALGAVQMAGFVGGGSMEYETRIRIDSLSTSNQRVVVECGLQLTTTLANSSAFCVEFLYTDTANSGAWVAICSTTGAQNRIASAVTVAANTWYKLKVKLNAAGTSAEFFINGTSIGSITGHIPTSNYLSPMVLERKQIGTAARKVIMDYIWCRYRLTTPR